MKIVVGSILILCDKALVFLRLKEIGLTKSCYLFFLLTFDFLQARGRLFVDRQVLRHSTDFINCVECELLPIVFCSFKNDTKRIIIFCFSLVQPKLFLLRFFNG